MCVCVRACVRACVCACVRARACVSFFITPNLPRTSNFVRLNYLGSTLDAWKLIKLRDVCV